MILPTMTPEEKHRQMVELRPYIEALANKTLPLLYAQLRRAKVFPYYVVSPEVDMPNMGRWRIVFTGESKSNIRNGVCTIRAYQTFSVTHAKNPLNNGTGIYMFNANDRGQTQFNEYPPHYFNRLRERFIEPKGIVQPSFHELVKRMMTLHHASIDMIIRGYVLRRGADGLYSIERNNGQDRKDGYDNFVSYHKEGVSLGVCKHNKEYVNFTTFVPNSLLREGQREMQQKHMEMLRRHQYHQRLNPFAEYDSVEWISSEQDY